MKHRDNKETRTTVVRKEDVDKNTETNRILDGKLLASMLRGGAAQLRSNADEVNNLNVFPVPDGDTGDNMRMTIEGGVAALEGVQSNNLADVAKKLSQGMLLGARGNSGVILSQFFAGMAKGFAEHTVADAKTVAQALREGVKQAYASVITPTEGTILTVAREAVEYSVSRVSDTSTLTTLFSDLIKEMYNSLQRTPDILAVLKEAGVIDSGGAGLFYIMQGFYKILIGEEIDMDIELPPTLPQTVDLSSFGPDSEMEYGYCTELLLQLQNRKVNIEEFDVTTIIDFLKTFGDSIVAFKSDSIVKIHVHTLTPDKVLAHCRQYGEFLTVKIENMNVQHSESLEMKTEKRTHVPKRKDYGTVAVASGRGIKALFKQLGVDAVVEGGQTKNPSANDFIAAFDAVNADHIYVFPNNSNIIMAAKQAASMYENGTVHVIESKDLGQGYAAISTLNFQSNDPEAIEASLSAAMTMVKTGHVSTSIRNAELNGVHIECGDYIGFVGKEMLVSCKDVVTAATDLLSKMGESSDIYLITAFVGHDAEPEQVEQLRALVADRFPDAEFYDVDGGQEVYPFIFVVE